MILHTISAAGIAGAAACALVAIAGIIVIVVRHSLAADKTLHHAKGRKLRDSPSAN